MIFGFEVCKIEKDGDYFVVYLVDSCFVKIRVLINCVGVYVDEISKMVGVRFFKIYLRCG